MAVEVVAAAAAVNPVTLAVAAGIFVVASIAQTLTARSAAKTQRFQIDLNTQQQLLENAEIALQRSKAFTDSISMAAAQSALGTGGATGFTQAAFKGLGNFRDDMRALDNRSRIAEISGMGLKQMSAKQQQAQLYSTIASTVAAGASAGLFTPAPVVPPVA